MHERNVNNNIVFFLLGKYFCNTVKPVYSNKSFYNNNFYDTDIFRRTNVVMNSSISIVLLFSLLVVSKCTAKHSSDSWNYCYSYSSLKTLTFLFLLKFIQKLNITVINHHAYIRLWSNGNNPFSKWATQEAYDMIF